MLDVNSPAQPTNPANGRLAATDGISAPIRPPAEILAGAQAARFVVQDFCPLAESIEWELGQRYWQQRGNKAFIGDVMPVPFTINNDGNLSANAAEVFFASLDAADAEGHLEPRIFVLELGIGVGLFARYFLDRFQELCARKGKDYYDRLVYVAADRSERMLLDACKHGIFADHPDRYLLRTVDALCPQRDLGPDIAFAGQARPFRAVFLNYLLDCLPAAVLQVGAAEVMQLCVRTCLARDTPLHEHTSANAEDLARFASSSDPRERQRLMPVVSLLASEYDYLPVQEDAVPYGAFAIPFARSAGGSCVLHNFGAIQCLENLLILLHEQGFVLFSDYRWAAATKPDDFEHQRFSQATGVGVNFPLLKAYFADAQKCLWLEPPEDNESIVSRILAHGLAPAAAACFAERFGKAAHERLQEPWEAARNRLRQGRFEAAVTAYGKALERQPHNWWLMLEVANFLLFTLNSPAAGLDMARTGLRLNPTCSTDLWNTFGDCLYALGRIEESRRAFLRALQVNPADVRAHYNLAWVFAHQRDYAAALKTIAEGLSLDKTGGYIERLLKKQAEVLQLMAHRDQQELQRMANRISSTLPRGQARYAETIEPKQAPVTSDGQGNQPTPPGERARDGGTSS